MKKKLISLFILLSVFHAYAQKKQETESQDKPSKAERISERLGLSPEEREAFIPLFEEYKNTVKALKKTYKDKWMEVKGRLDKISDEEAAKLADDYIILQQKIFDVKKAFHAKFKDVLPPKKLLELYKGKAKQKKKK